MPFPTAGQTIYGLWTQGSEANADVETRLKQRGYNIMDGPYSAVGDGVTVDRNAIATAIAAGTGKLIVIPAPTVAFLVDGQTTVPTKTALQGGGRGSLIKTLTPSHHLVQVASPGAVLRNLSLQGLFGSTAFNNSAIAFLSGASDGLVAWCEASGMSGDALFATTCDNITLFGNYVHGLTGDLTTPNSADIAFFTDVSYCSALFNRLMGGGQTEVGIINQINSIKNLNVGNRIGGHASYGIIDYETVAKSTWSIHALNRIEDIDGTNFSGSKGAGYYQVQTGGQIVALNQIANTNIGTSNETLVPAALAVSILFSPMLALGNMINVPNWYGIKFVSSTTAIAEFAHNHIFEPKKTAIRVHASSHASITGGSVTMLTATPLTQTAVMINTTDVAPFKNVSVKGLHIRGSARGFDTNFTDNLTIALCQVSEVVGIPCKVANGVGGVIVDNNFDATADASATALDVTNMTYSVFKGNILRSNGGTTKVVFSGTNTGSVFDETNVLVGVANPMNFINNTGAGCKVTQYGTAVPTGGNHQVGDRVINSAPAVGSPKAWVCTVAGLPGTWVSEGNL